MFICKLLLFSFNYGRIRRQFWKGDLISQPGEDSGEEWKEKEDDNDLAWVSALPVAATFLLGVQLRSSGETGSAVWYHRENGWGGGQVCLYIYSECFVLR